MNTGLNVFVFVAIPCAAFGAGAFDEWPPRDYFIASLVGDVFDELEAGFHAGPRVEVATLAARAAPRLGLRDPAPLMRELDAAVLADPDRVR